MTPEQLRDTFFLAYCRYRPRPERELEEENWTMSLGYSWKELLGVEDNVYWDDLLKIPAETLKAAIQKLNELTAARGRK